MLLDGVSDPGNVGTLLRTSVAVGVKSVLLLPGTCDVWNPKTVRSAMGATFYTPTRSVSSWEEAVQVLQDEYTCKAIWAATMLDEEDGSGAVNTPHYEVDWKSQASALVIGSEGAGLSAEVREALETNSKNSIRAVHVPMENAMESLNAAVCGSVILFEYLRQQRQER